MIRDLDVMTNIQSQKSKDMRGNEPHPLDAEGIKMAEHKRYTFDIIDLPTDPLR